MLRRSLLTVIALVLVFAATTIVGFYYLDKTEVTEDTRARDSTADGSGLVETGDVFESGGEEKSSTRAESIVDEPSREKAELAEADSLQSSAALQQMGVLDQLENEGEPELNAQITSVSGQNRELIAMLKELHSTDEGNESIEMTMAVESNFIELVDNDPNAVIGLLDEYEKMSASRTREYLGSLISSTHDPRIEALALDRLQTEGSVDQEKWLHLLKGTGINSHEDRAEYFNYLYSIDSPALLADSLKAFHAGTSSPEDTAFVFERLGEYRTHDHAEVRAASIEVSSRWMRLDEPGMIENGLADEAHQVRHAAITSATYAGVRSEQIKSDLLKILGDGNEPHTVRVEAYNALNSYDLAPDEYQNYLEFQKVLEELGHFSNTAKG